jgi:hypothetical protein
MDWIFDRRAQLFANFPKLLLSVITIWFNLLFFLQRTVLYSKAAKAATAATSGGALPLTQRPIYNKATPS